ncbi:MAG: DUF1489 domain-containing protein, partial [Proteobacteria bacterium]|nr:DUF1489 domain-containing protein [Pseudomonadota bacterium]
QHLVRSQAGRLGRARERGEAAVLRHYTRHTPRRSAELTDGGSLYWVIKGFIRVRQEFRAVERGVNAEGRPSCALVLAPGLVRTSLRACRPFQGWRYLGPENAPADLSPLAGETDGVPRELAAELRQLGLL